MLDKTAEDKALDRLPPDARAKLRQSEASRLVAPMLATLTEERFCREGWLFEPKLDGERCLVYRDTPRLELHSRNQKLLNSKYPELVASFEKQRPVLHRGWGNCHLRKLRHEFRENVLPVSHQHARGPCGQKEPQI
jgi:hypothetical protein